jgi:hypothetical protein
MSADQMSLKADLNDKSSIVKAIDGSHAVFAVTNYWEHLDMDLEIRQGKSIADAAKVSFLDAIIPLFFCSQGEEREDC